MSVGRAGGRVPSGLRSGGSRDLCSERVGGGDHGRASDVGHGLCVCMSNFRLEFELMVDV